jgi:hypothetical protein
VGLEGMKENGKERQKRGRKAVRGKKMKALPQN